jgi:hypothetical protein
MRSSSSYSYKKNKLDQLKGFCAVVECGSIAEAAKVLCISEPSVSLQISSLEKDLGVQLFDKVGRSLKLNQNGRAYYEKASEILKNFEDLYNKDFVVKISKWDIWKIRFNNFLKFCFDNNVNRILKSKFFKVVFVQNRNIVVLLCLLCFGCFCYLYRTNYFFEREIEKLMNPIVKNVVNSGHRTLYKKDLCSNEIEKFLSNIHSISLYLTKQKKTNIYAIEYGQIEAFVMRLTGDDKKDMLLNNMQEYKHYCNNHVANELFDLLKSRFPVRKKLFESGRFNLYNFYYEDNYDNYDILQENKMKYKNHFFTKKVNPDTFPLHLGVYYIMKYRWYYYFLSAQCVYVNLGKKDEHLSECYYVYKKMDRNNLKVYDQGRLWNVLQRYGIKID